MLKKLCCWGFSGHRGERVNAEGRTRLATLRTLLVEGRLGTQDELRDELERQKFKVTQSTVSRDLRKLGAVRAIDPRGLTVYRLPEEPKIMTGGPLGELVSGMRANQSLIVIQTLPGSASLIARHLDQLKPAGILGTIAGDDTIFVAPASKSSIRSTMTAIERCLSELQAQA